MKTRWFVISLLLCPAFAVVAGEHQEKSHGEYAHELRVLDRNIKLVFQAIPLDPGDTELFIITASPHYEVDVRLEGDDGELFFGVSGEIELTDDGKIFVTYEAHMALSGDDGKAEFNSGGGAILKPGKPFGVAKIGEKTLVITASYVKD